jgi:hypothetical protein
MSNFVSLLSIKNYNPFVAPFFFVKFLQPQQQQQQQQPQ